MSFQHISVLKIINDKGYDELRFNSGDLSETADELQVFVLKVQKSITTNKLYKSKGDINDTIDLWNKRIEFINQATVIIEKLNLLGYLMRIIEDNIVENTLEYTVLETLRSFLNN